MRQYLFLAVLGASINVFPTQSAMAQHEFIGPQVRWSQVRSITRFQTFHIVAAPDRKICWATSNEITGAPKGPQDRGFDFSFLSSHSWYGYFNGTCDDIWFAVYNPCNTHSPVGGSSYSVPGQLSFLSNLRSLDPSGDFIRGGPMFELDEGTLERYDQITQPAGSCLTDVDNWLEVHANVMTMPRNMPCSQAPDAPTRESGWYSIRICE